MTDRTETSRTIDAPVVDTGRRTRVGVTPTRSEAVRRSARAVVEEHIARIERTASALNAVVVPRFAEARADADAADARRTAAAAEPLFGVPVTIKESIDVAGMPTTVGVTARTGARAPADSPLVARLRRAGAIVVGKTNVAQLMLFHESDNPVYGRTNNPWNAERTAGGSSGGEAAAIAAGGAVLGLGTDIGGSIRVPAHFCGIHGLKPTARRLTTAGMFETFRGQGAVADTPGPMARTVADLTLAMTVLAAPAADEADPDVPPAPLGDPEAVRVRGLRVGYYDDDGVFPAAPAIRRAVHEAADALRLGGAEVVTFAPPDVARGMRLYFGALGADGGAGARRHLGGGATHRTVGALLQLAALPAAARALVVGAGAMAAQPRLAELVRSLGARSVHDYWHLVAELTAYRARFLAALDALGLDALVCPPHALPALRHGSSYFLTSAACYSMLYNLLGMPAGVVAATRVRPGEESDRPPSRDLVERTAASVERGSAGLPVGVQVVGRHWREDVVLAVMAALEEHFSVREDYPAYPPL
ncbi:MAG TPA: amidase family protein [Gemmatimonadaceae bacterium]|nr:amidase family protein [Gemmatimonadaceae bacterium]